MPAGATYEPIATTTLGSAASSITFSSIPATYTDLRLVLISTNVSGGGTTTVQLNGDTSAVYSQTFMQGNAINAASSRFANNNFWYLGNEAVSTTVPVLITMDIFSYAGSNFKTALHIVNNDKNGTGSVEQWVSLWRSTSAISSILLTRGAGQYQAGSTATLYGIKAA